MHYGRSIRRVLLLLLLLLPLCPTPPETPTASSLEYFSPDEEKPEYDIAY